MRATNNRNQKIFNNLRGLMRHMSTNMLHMRKMTVSKYESDNTAVLCVFFDDRVYSIKFASYTVLIEHFLRSRRSWHGITYEHFTYSGESMYMIENSKRTIHKGMTA